VARAWSRRWLSTASWLSRLAWRAWNSARCPASASVTRGSAAPVLASGASRSGGKRISTARPISATRRACWASSAARWAWAASTVAPDWTSSRRRTSWPCRTRSPSRTRISRTRPPSRCCRVRRVPSTLMVPGASAASASGASVAQARKPPPKPSMVTRPRARATPARGRSPGAGRGRGSGRMAADISCGLRRGPVRLAAWRAPRGA
jgi:hypothetical protein